MRAFSVAASLFAAGFLAAALGACTAPVRTLPGNVQVLPVVVASKGLGRVLHGSIRIEQIQGSYTVSKGTFSCSGSYTLSAVRGLMYVPILCSDGRKGTASVRNGPSRMSGTGSLTMNDGSTGEFAFGKDTKKLSPASSAQ
ncbi:hypothetical protein AB4037_16540 [Labrys sp. KB_33_2]|uniref:hypothetical protein n=1 Tax=Labrys sp. KB_33_2 TaxID=3237479 RepID=UPI003F90AFC4